MRDLIGEPAMNEQVQQQKGPIDGAGRVLRELLRTPNFKKSVRLLITDLDPENAAVLVRILMWEDPEFFLGLLGATPSVLNAAVEGTREVALQLSAFPVPLLAGFLAGITEDLDAEAAGEALGLVVSLLSRVNAANDQSLGEAAAGAAEGFRRGFVRGISGEEPVGAADRVLEAVLPLVEARIARMGEEAGRPDSDTARFVRGLAEGIEGMAERNPDFVEGVVKPLSEAWRSSMRCESGGEEAP